mgnify:FL=1
MEITDIRVRKVNSEGKLKAVVSVTFDGVFVVHDIKLIENEGRMFISMPNKRVRSGEYKDIAHPVNPEMREALERSVISAYEDYLKTSAESEESEE